MLKLGIIGYGHRAAVLVRLIKKLKLNVKVHAVADIDIESSKKRLDDAAETVNFYHDADKMLDTERLDGVLVGTRCNLHTPMGIKVLKRDLPIFLEKPVATSIEQIRRLADVSTTSRDELSVVSFPLRLSPLVARAREIIEAGEIGRVEQAQAFNYVHYGRVYFDKWYRDYSITQGLFLQKATHDIDYLTSLIGCKPRRVAAMFIRGHVYGGDKPAGLRCNDCDEYETCPESPFNEYFSRRKGDKVSDKDHMCCFGEDIGDAKTGCNEDASSCLIEYENGAQVTYAQNFFVKGKAGSRGATLIGKKGTVWFDWHANQLKLFRHNSPGVETFELGQSDGHGGGDIELAYDFIRTMRGEKVSRSRLSDGILSALTCLCCRQSAETGEFVTIPKL